MVDVNFAARDMKRDACLSQDALRDLDRVLTLSAFKHSDLPELLGVYQIVTEIRDESDGCLKVLGNLIDAARNE